MITISRQTDYACRIILHLAMQPGRRITAAEIARQRLIPQALIRRIVTQLGVARLLRTTRGSDGGITLARPPNEISLLDVVQAVEGPLLLNICTGDPESCPMIPVCAVHEAWMDAREVLHNQLRQVTFDRLAERGLALQPPISSQGDNA